MLGRVSKLKIGPFRQQACAERPLHQDRGRESILLPLPPNRTGGSPAYGSPVGGFTWLRIDELPHHRKEIPADKQRNVNSPFLPIGSSTWITLIATVSSVLQPLKPLQLA